MDPNTVTNDIKKSDSISPRQISHEYVNEPSEESATGRGSRLLKNYVGVKRH